MAKTEVPQALEDYPYIIDPNHPDYERFWEDFATGSTLIPEEVDDIIGLTTILEICEMVAGEQKV